MGNKTQGTKAAKANGTAESTAIAKDVSMVDQNSNVFPMEAGDLVKLPLSKLYVEEDPTALDFDPRILSTLAPEFVADIIANGIRLSLVVRLMPDGRYKVVDGKTRYRAAIVGGLALAPCHIASMDDRTHLRTQVALNAHRFEDEIGAQISNAKRLIGAGFSRDEVALAFCKPVSTIGTLLDVDAKLVAPEAKALVAEGALGLGAAQVMADAAPAVQEKLAEKIREVQDIAANAPDGKTNHITGGRKADAQVTKGANGDRKIKVTTGGVKSLRDAIEKSVGGTGMKSAPVNKATKPTEAEIKHLIYVAKTAASGFVGAEGKCSRAFAFGVEYALRYALGVGHALPDGATAANTMIFDGWTATFAAKAAKADASTPVAAPVAAAS